MAEIITNEEVLKTASESNMLVVGEGASFASNAVYQAFAHSTAIAMENNVARQNNLNIMYPAIVASAAELINNA